MLTESQTLALLTQQLNEYIVHTLPATSAGRAGEGVLLAVKQHPPYLVNHLQLEQRNSTIWLTLKPAHTQQAPLTLRVCYIRPTSNRSVWLRRNSAQARFKARRFVSSTPVRCLSLRPCLARVGNSIQPWVTELGPGIPVQLENTDNSVNPHGLKLLHMCEDTAMDRHGFIRHTGTGQLQSTQQHSALSPGPGPLWVLSFFTPCRLAKWDLSGRSQITFR